jgi:hypothetical protein
MGSTCERSIRAHRKVIRVRDPHHDSRDKLLRSCARPCILNCHTARSRMKVIRRHARLPQKKGHSAATRQQFPVNHAANGAAGSVRIGTRGSNDRSSATRLQRGHTSAHIGCTRAAWTRVADGRWLRALDNLAVSRHAPSSPTESGGAGRVPSRERAFRGSLPACRPAS